jgi:hypothetical protein
MSRDVIFYVHQNGKVEFCKVIMKGLNSKFMSHIGGAKEKRKKQQRKKK